MPQYIVINLSDINFALDKLKYVGIYNWRKSFSNPKWIELLVSCNKYKQYESIGNFYLVNKSVTQLLSISNNLPNKIKGLIVKENWGADRVYINNILFLKKRQCYDNYENCEFLISDSIENLLSDN